MSTSWGKVDQWRGRATVQSQLQVPKAERQWSGDSRDREGLKPSPGGERDACNKGHCTHKHTDYTALQLVSVPVGRYRLLHAE